MKLCRFQPRVISADQIGANSHPEVFQGVISGETVREISGDIFTRWSVTNRSWPLTDVKLLPPVMPSKIVCLGRNYVEHAAEFNNPTPKEPLIFLKPPSSLLAPDDPIVLPPGVQRIDFEGELAVIISKECSQLRDGDDVRPYIAGYTCLNDVSARDLQKSDVQFTRAKGFDTFCPIGPHIETNLNPSNVLVETRVNGVLRQSGNTSLMVYSPTFLVRWISRMMTLFPGDVITTGTPAGVGPLMAGDTVEVSVAGIGVLRNPVHAPQG